MSVDPGWNIEISVEDGHVVLTAVTVRGPQRYVMVINNDPHQARSMAARLAQAADACDDALLAALRNPAAQA